MENILTTVNTSDCNIPTRNLGLITSEIFVNNIPSNSPVGTIGGGCILTFNINRSIRFIFDPKNCYVRIASASQGYNDWGRWIKLS